MNPSLPLATDQRLIYPDSDGEPIGENTVQFRWIVMIQGNLDAQFADDPQVLVAGDLFWYPLQGQTGIRTAPDVLLAFGRAKGDRSAYLQWEEGNVAPQVVWEIFSPGNRPGEMLLKFDFYQRFGVEEYYLYDPATNAARGWRRSGEQLVEIETLAGWISPRQQVRFEFGADGLELYYADGRRFLTFAELARQATAEQQRADTEAERADAEAQRADAERKQTQREAARAQAETERANAEAERAERLAAHLRSLGIDPDSV